MSNINMGISRAVYSIRRHAEKGADGSLTQEGVQASREIGVRLRKEHPCVEVYSSPAQRAVQTGENILKGYGYGRDRMVLPAYALSPLDPPEPEGITDRDEIIQYWLDNEWKKQDGSKGEMYKAGRNALLHLASVMSIDRKQDGTRIEGISHAPLVEAGLAMLTGERDIRSFGGSFRPGESLDLIVDSRGEDIRKITAGFRGTEYPIKEMIPTVQECRKRMLEWHNPVEYVNNMYGCHPGDGNEDYFGFVFGEP